MTELSAEQRQILVEAIKDFNDTLQTQSINLSGQAFNNAFRLGCGILLIPLAVVLIVTQVVKGLAVSGVFVYSCLAAAIALVFAILVSSRAKTLAVQEKYQRDINPDIVRFLAENGLTRAQFDLVSDDVLAENAPLRQYLVKST